MNYRQLAIRYLSAARRVGDDLFDMDKNEMMHLLAMGDAEMTMGKRSNWVTADECEMVRELVKEMDKRRLDETKPFDEASARERIESVLRRLAGEEAA